MDPTEIIRRAKDATRAQAEKLKNPPVPAGTRRSDVVHAICHACGKRTLLAASSRQCGKCWEKEMKAADEMVAAMEKEVAGA